MQAIIRPNYHRNSNAGVYKVFFVTVSVPVPVMVVDTLNSFYYYLCFVFKSLTN